LKTIALVLFAAGIVGCSDPSPTVAAVADPICSAITARCHPYASIPGLPTECHEIGDSNNATTCRARQAECFAACVAPTDSGVTDASVDASVDASADAAVDAPHEDTADAAADAHHGH